MIINTLTHRFAFLVAVGFMFLLFACQPNAQSAKEDYPFKIDFVSLQQTFPGCDPEKENCGEVYLSIPVASGQPAYLTQAVRQSVVSYMQANLDESFSLKPGEPLVPKIEKTINRIVNVFADAATEEAEDVSHWTLRMESSIKYQSDKVLVLSYPHFEFSGGAHPLFSTSFVNIDKSNGKELTYNDLFDNQDKLKAKVKEGFLSAIQAKTRETEKPELTEFFGGQEFSLPEYFAILENSILFLYYPEEAAPFVYGEIEVEIPKDQLF